MAFLTRRQELYFEKNTQRQLVPSQEKRLMNICRLENKLRNQLLLSVNVCPETKCYSFPNLRPLDRPTDMDMVWVPWFRKWCCEKCYNVYYRNMTFRDFIECHDVFYKSNKNFVKEMELKFKDSFDSL